MATTTRCCGWPAGRRADPRAFLERSEAGHLDLPRAREGGFAGGMFALFVPSKRRREQKPERTESGYEVPLPEAPKLAEAQRATLALAASLFRIEAASDGRLKVVRSVARAARLSRRRHARRGAAHRGRRGDRSRARHAGGALPGRAALDRHRLEPAERLRPRRAVPLSELARHRPRPDRGRRAPGQGLQPARHPDRRLAPQRERLLGRGADLRAPDRGDPLQRPRAVPGARAT